MKRTERVYEHWPLWLAIAADLAVSSAFFFMVRERELKFLRVELSRQSEVQVRAIEQSLRRNLDALDSLVGLLSAHPQVSRRQFQTFVQTGELLSRDIQALEWIPRVLSTQREAFEQRAQAWSPGYQFTERRDGHMVRASERKQYYPVYYLEPLSGNEKALGFDLASDQRRRMALRLAQQTGKPIATGRINLVQESGAQAGFLVFQPVFVEPNKNQSADILRGYVLGAFRVGDMVQAALAGEHFEGVELNIQDVGSSGSAQELFASDNWSELKSDDLQLSIRIPIATPGRNWVAEFRPTQRFLDKFGPRKAQEVFAVSLFYTVILASFLAWYFRRLSRETRRAQGLALQLQLVNQELELSRNHLEKRVEERTRQLLVQTQELQRSNADLEQFAHISAHDLQEPIRMVASYVELISTRYYDMFDDRASRHMLYIVEGANRMQALVDDLLRYAQVGASNSPLAEVDLQEALAAALSSLRLTIHEEGAEVMSNALPTVRAHLQQLVQILQNLMGNALKYRGKECPKIEVTATMREPGWWTIVVQDNGLGIKPEYHEKVFQMFQRLHKRGQYPGTGAGLAIARKMVERAGGQLWVESTGQAGAAFLFTLQAVELSST